MALFLAFLIGFLAGLRSLTPPAAIAWGAHLGWLKLQGTLALFGSFPAAVILTLLAAVELVADKLPQTPNRTSLPGLLARVVMGKVAGMCIATAGGQSIWLGALCGIIGALAGCYGGYYARTRIVKALGTKDFYVALAEDLIALAGCLWVVTRF